MISSLVARVSAATLLLGGLVMLFVPDEALSMLAPGFPANGTWIAQLVAAAWLALASLNWTSRAQIIGGVYGRPMVYANVLVYTISALSVFRVLMRGDGPRLLWLLALPMAGLAVVYGAVMLKGPFDRLDVGTGSPTDG
jgi:hypothetical protein